MMGVIECEEIKCTFADDDLRIWVLNSSDKDVAKGEGVRSAHWETDTPAGELGIIRIQGQLKQD